MLRGCGAVFTTGFDELSLVQSRECRLNSAFGKSGTFGNSSQAGRERTPAAALGDSIQMQVHEERCRLPIVTDQVSHQNIQNIIVDRYGAAETRHAPEYTPMLLIGHRFLVSGWSC